MKHDRLHGLSDGIFAIAMTLLVIELHIPKVKDVSNDALWDGLVHSGPLFLSFILSFAVLFTYWRSHNFVISNLAKNLDVSLTNYNALFLFFVVLIPFSSNFLGEYYNTQIAIAVFSVNVIALSGTLLLMRSYILRSKSIVASGDWSKSELLNGFIRMAVPAICGAAAILVSFIDTNASLILLTVAVLFNFSKSSTAIARKIIGR